MLRNELAATPLNDMLESYMKGNPGEDNLLHLLLPFRSAVLNCSPHCGLVRSTGGNNGRRNNRNCLHVVQPSLGTRMHNAMQSVASSYLQIRIRLCDHILARQMLPMPVKQEPLPPSRSCL